LFIININTLANSEKNIKDDRIVIEEKSIIKEAKKRGKALKGVSILDSA
jgi:hypothetical protein